MTVEDQIREIMLSEELPDSEKLDRLHALIPADVLKIDNLNKATPGQLRRLKESMAVSEAIQQIRRRTTQQKGRAKPGNNSQGGSLAIRPLCTSRQSSDIQRSVQLTLSLNRVLGCDHRGIKRCIYGWFCPSLPCHRRLSVR